jgi:predicted TIM-barrel enzyme
MTPERAGELAPLLHGAIVGTWLKRGGSLREPVDEGRVRQMAAALKGRLRTG